jgi:hypothetical protein
MTSPIKKRIEALEATEADASSKRKQRAKPLSGIDIVDVMKARKDQDRILKARLKQIQNEVDKLMDEHDRISDVLGIKRDDDQQEPDVVLPDGFNADAIGRVIGYKCADCGSTLGPNSQGDCQGCGAGPFEQAR